ncbi:MAG: dihydroorotase [Alphaproteobacteria bacterium]|nr:dihydroorotase [Alphaproteobacteria bacterium]
MTGQQLIIRRPDDWHLHLRDGAMLDAVLPSTARAFGRAVVMPNLVPPILTTRDAAAYRNRINNAPKGGARFVPLMTLYLTDGTSAQEVEKGFNAGVVFACKLYPRNATTNSESGVTDIALLGDVLACMEEIGMPLLVHGEVTDAEVDIFDRETRFIERVLTPLMADFPGLRVVFEHITTADAVDFVMAGPERLAATITPHHLMIDRNDMFDGGIRPHLFCLPVAKAARHRVALRRAAVSGHRRIFLGTDSAPHAIAAKEQACGCAGIFNAPVAMEAYATVFEQEGALERLENFASHFGPEYYGLPVNEETLILERDPWTVPERIDVAGEERRGGIQPFLAGQTINWRVAGIGPPSKGPVL